GSAPILFSAMDDGMVLTPQPILTDSLGIAACLVRLGNREGIYTFKAELNNGQFVLFQATAIRANQAPKIISMSPSETTVRFAYYRLLRFEILQVIDSEGDPIRFAWRLNDHLIGIESHTAVYTDPTLPESSVLRCTVSDGKDSTFAEWNLIYSPETAVTLDAFKAEANDQGVLLHWSLPSIADIAFFEIYRDDGQQRLYQLINKQTPSASVGTGNEFQYIDQSASTPGKYHYQLVAVFKSGGKKPFEPISVEILAPSDLTLHQNYPNPFNPTTLISFDLPEPGQIRLIIFDKNGRQVRELLNGDLPAGRHTSIWDGCDDQGRKVSSGSYFYELITAHEKLTRKLTMIK
ncbi:MAG: T9SS C-terminal target domain-containing protein, partial [Calditrichaeota bacterium]